MIDEKKHVAVMSLFRVRFTYTVDYVPFSRIALVKATSPLRAKEYITEWLNTNGVILPSLQYRSVTRCTDFSYIIDPDAFPTRQNLSKCLTQTQSIYQSKLSMEEFLERLGEFNEPNQPSFF